ETEYRKAIEATIGPFKGLLLGMFFFTVGMSIDVRELLRAPVWLVASVAGLIAIKGALFGGLARLFRIPWPAAIETSLLLGPGGDSRLGGGGGAGPSGRAGGGPVRSPWGAPSLSWALTPPLALVGRRIAARLEGPRPIAAELAALPPADGERRAIVIGHGRV